VSDDDYYIDLLKMDENNDCYDVIILLCLRMIFHDYPNSPLLIMRRIFSEFSTENIHDLKEEFKSTLFEESDKD
jgi:hypothetical protein